MLATDSYDEFNANADANATKALIKLRGELIRLYDMLIRKGADLTELADKVIIKSAVDAMEAMSKTAHERCSFTYAPLSELAKLQ